MNAQSFEQHKLLLEHFSSISQHEEFGTEHTVYIAEDVVYKVPIYEKERLFTEIRDNLLAEEHSIQRLAPQLNPKLVSIKDANDYYLGYALQMNRISKPLLAEYLTENKNISTSINLVSLALDKLLLLASKNIPTKIIEPATFYVNLYFDAINYTQKIIKYKIKFSVLHEAYNNFKLLTDIIMQEPFQNCIHGDLHVFNIYADSKDVIFVDPPVTPMYYFCTKKLLANCLSIWWDIWMLLETAIDIQPLLADSLKLKLFQYHSQETVNASSKFWRVLVNAFLAVGYAEIYSNDKYNDTLISRVLTKSDDTDSLLLLSIKHFKDAIGNDL